MKAKGSTWGEDEAQLHEVKLRPVAERSTPMDFSSPCAQNKKGNAYT